MKKCKNQNCGWEWPDSVETCSVCGGQEFNDPSVAELTPTTRPPPSCCCNAECSSLMFFSGAKYCSDCGRGLLPVSWKVWESKVVYPSLEKDISGVAMDPIKVLHSASKMGFMPEEAQARFESLFKGLTNVSCNDFRQWLQRTVLPQLGDENCLEARQKALLVAKELNISETHAELVLDQLAHPIADSSKPTESSEQTPNTLESIETALRASADWKAQEIIPSIDSSFADPGRNSAKSFYLKLVAGGSVSRNVTYLNLERSMSKKGSREFLKEVPHSQGQFVLFAKSNTEGFVFPNPKLATRHEAVAVLFPFTTEDQFNKFKQYIDPISVTRVGDGRWKVGSPERNISRPTQTHEAAQPEIKEAKTVRPPISTPKTGNNLVPRILGSVILLLCVAIVVGIAWRSRTWVKEDPQKLAVEVPVQMILVHGGTFFMGSNTGDELERPQHSVEMKPFFLDTNEVTSEDYEKFVNAANRRAPAGWADGHFPQGAARHPVTGVDWYDAKDYCRWTSKRLPTEEEWEYAARGTTGFRYPWGNEWRANAANAGELGAGKLTDVGSFPDGKSPFGAMDMIGNAWEWTASDFKPYPGGQIGVNSGAELKVIRGASWKQDKEATATYRGFLPSKGSKDYGSTGFRCAADIRGSPDNSK